MSADTGFEVPAFFRSSGPVRARSKVARSALPGLCLSFCWPRSVKDAAQLSGLSLATVRSSYVALRRLLFDPRYRRWHGFDVQSPYQLDPVLSALIWQLLWSSYAECYGNEECQRNYLYKKRKRRECAQCPILQSEALRSLINDAHRAHWLRIVDRTREFYLSKIGMRREDGFAREIFKQRAYHQQIVGAARARSMVRTAAGKRAVDHARRGPGTVHDLWQTMLIHIAERGSL